MIHRRFAWALHAACAVLLAGPGQAQQPTDEQPARPRQKVAVFELRAAGLPEETASSLMGVLTQAVAEAPWLDVISRDEVATMLDAEAQKQLLGCDDTGCLAEIAGALDVDLLIAGSVAVLGSGTVVNLQLINQRFANVMNRVSLTWPGDNERLPEVIGAAAQLLILEPADRPAITVQVLDAVEETEVFLDQQSQGSVGADGSLSLDEVAVGIHQLRLAAPGHQARELPFVARSGKNVRVNGALEPLPVTSTWWFWTGAAGVGVALAAAATVAAVLWLGDNTGGVIIQADPGAAQEAR